MVHLLGHVRREVVDQGGCHRVGLPQELSLLQTRLHQRDARPHHAVQAYEVVWEHLREPGMIPEASPDV